MATALRYLGIAVVALLMATWSSSAQGQMRMLPPDGLPSLDGGTRAAVVDSITAVIDSVYVLGDAAQRIVTGLRANLRSGAYDELDDPTEFVQRLEADAQAMNHDGHFGIRVLPPLDPEYADQEQDPRAAARQERADRAQNFGFREAKIMPGGVGYLRFDRFASPEPEAFEAATAAMNFLARSDAVILDLRQNGGGSAAMIRFIAGYFFDERTHLINWFQRVHDRTVQSYSADYVPGRRLLTQPLYILTSGRTGSAAEEFTFDMRNLERATVVGDTTAGAGHTVAGYVFDFSGFRVMIRVPFGRAYNPENNEGWEGVGVAPHIVVPAAQALDTAYADALRRLKEGEEDEGYRASLDWALRDVASRANPVSLPAAQLAEYVGTYGPRRIFLDEGQLFYQRDDRPRLALQPMGEDVFRVGELDFFRLGFERDPAGKVMAVVGMYDNGERDRHAREARR